jgi:DNA-directed RNA polymerase specialized sigma24 family protein
MRKSPEPKDSTAAGGEALTYLWRWLDAEPEQAGLRYELLRRKLCLFFIGNRTRCPEELADHTLDRVARRLADGEVIRAEDPASYCLGVARNILHEYWRAPELKNETLDELPRQVDFAAAERERRREEEQRAHERRLACLSACLQRLPQDERELIQSYYHAEGESKEHREQVAQHFDIGMIALRTRAFRIRRKLARQVKGCLERQEK